MRRVLAKMHFSRALVLGSLCIALVLMSGMIQAAHFHASAQPDHDCALCMTAHSVAQASAPVALLFTSLRVEALPAPRAIARPHDAVHFRLACRPPPLSSLA